MKKYEFEQVKAHDIKTHSLSFFVTLFTEIILVSFAGLGIFLWKTNFLSAVCLINGLVIPLIIPRNLTIMLDFRFYGKTIGFDPKAFIKHYLNLGFIELCVVGASFPFMSTVYFVLVAISLPVILGLIMLLVMERHSFSQLHQFLDMDRQRTEKIDYKE